MKTFAFCPLCAARFKTKVIGGTKRLYCPNCGYVFYRNATPAVSALVLHEHKILLVRRAVFPRKGWWDVPGGFVELREDPVHAMKREFKEELGVDAKVERLLGIFIDTYYVEVGPPSKVLNIYYSVSCRNKRFTPADDISKARWFPLSSLPARIAFKHIHRAIRKWA